MMDNLLEKPNLCLLIAEDNKKYRKELVEFFTAQLKKWPLVIAKQLDWDIQTCGSLEEFNEISEKLVSEKRLSMPHWI